MGSDQDKSQGEFMLDDYYALPKVYGFEDIIPVGIYGGDCQVDFGEIVRRAWGV